MSEKRKLLGPVILVSAAMIWGLSFIAQSEGTKYLETFTFNAIRNLLGTIVLIPLALIPLIIYRKNNKNNIEITKEEKKKRIRTTVLGILIVGTSLCIGLNLQQYAFNTVNPGKVGFITALYMLLVPIFGIFLKKKTPLITWLGVFVGVVGLFFLCLGPGADFSSIGKGEIVTLLGAVAFAIQIVAIDYFADKIHPLLLSCGQFFVAFIESSIMMLIFEHPDIHNISKAWVTLIYTGVFSCGIAFTFQIIGQKYTEPTLASMLLCLESVFSVIFEFIILKTSMQTFEYIGCAIMFVGIILAQINPKKIKRLPHR